LKPILNSLISIKQIANEMIAAASCCDCWLKLAGEGRPIALARANATLSRVDLLCEVRVRLITDNYCDPVL
jgi:hypothetical protein